jgi:hypothetical protein
MTRKTILIAAALFSSPAWAGFDGIQEMPKTFQGIRSAGMGGVITTTGNYSEALFGNPARHSEVDTWKWTMIEIQGEANSNLLGSTSNLGQIKGGSGSATISDASKIIGENEHARFHIMSAYYNPHFIGDLGFAAALMMGATTNLMVNYTTDLDTQTIIDVGPHLGFSHPFFDNTLSIGMNLHLVYRASSTGVFSSLDFLTGKKFTLQNFGQEGIGLDMDLGAYYHIPWEIPFMRISVGMSANGLTKTHYDDVQAAFLSGLGSRPVNDDRVLNAGMRFDFPDFWIMSAPMLAVEFQDTGDTNARYSFAKKTHIGWESKLSRVFSFRTGLYQGYLAAGVGIDLPVFKLDLATYGEELSGNAGNNEDRRFAARIAFEL